METVDKKAWLYELNDRTFKEKKVTIRTSYDDKGKALQSIAVYDDNTAKIVSPEEGKVYKYNFVWLEKRSKEQAAHIFRSKIKKEIDKHNKLIDDLRSRTDMVEKYLVAKATD